MGNISDLHIERLRTDSKSFMRTITINSEIPITVIQSLNDFNLDRSEMKIGDYVYGDGYLVGQVFLDKNQKKKAVKCKVLKIEILKGPEVTFSGGGPFAAKRYFVELEVKT